MEKSLEIVMSQIDQRRNDLVTAVAVNTVKDWAEYQRICGEIRGLSTAEGYILDLVKNMERDDD